MKRKSRTPAILVGMALVLVALLLWWPSTEDDSPEIRRVDPHADSPSLRPAGTHGNARTPDASVEIPLETAPDQSSSEPLSTGRVVDLSLRPVAGGHVLVHDPGSPDLSLLEEAPVDESGRFSLFKEQTLSRVSLTYTGSLLYAEEREVDLYPGAFVELIAQPLRTLRVRVVDKSGVPFENARVDGNLRKARGDAAAARTDKEGECDLVVGPGAFHVSAQTDTNLYGFAVRGHGQDHVEVMLDRELDDILIRVVAAPGSEHLKGTTVTLMPCHGVYPIREVAAAVGGEPVVVPVAHVDKQRSAAFPARSPQAARARIRFVKALRVRVGEEPEFRVPLKWTQFKRALQGDVLVLPVEDTAHKVILHLRDGKGNPVRGYAFQLVRDVPEALDQPLTCPLRAIEARSDHDGEVVCKCAVGTYTGPFAGRLEVEGPLERRILVGVTTAYGTAEPPVGHVRVVPLGQENADWSSFAKVPLKNGLWYANLEGVTPGTTMVAQWMDRWAPLASEEVVAGGDPVHLEVASVAQSPHRTALRVCAEGQPVWCELKLDTRSGRSPRVQRDLVGLRTFDLSHTPTGEYFMEITTHDKLVHLFDRPVHIGMGEVLQVDLQDADRIWDGDDGVWIRER